MKTYFISYLTKPVPAYSPNWYGVFDHCPNATIELYDDNYPLALGWTDSDADIVQLAVEHDSVSILNEQQYLTKLLEYEDKYDVDGIWFGDKLLHRWDSETV
jgi:hypothetical protein